MKKGFAKFGLRPPGFFLLVVAVGVGGWDLGFQSLEIECAGFRTESVVASVGMLHWIIGLGDRFIKLVVWGCGG